MFNSRNSDWLYIYDFFVFGKRARFEVLRYPIFRFRECFESIECNADLENNSFVVPRSLHSKTFLG